MSYFGLKPKLGTQNRIPTSILVCIISWFWHNQAWSNIFWHIQELFRHNALSLSRHKQVCLSSLNALVHDVINLVYYEHWTDKPKYFYVYSDISTTLCNPDIFRTLTYSVPRAYLETCQTNMMEGFAKLVNNYNYFPKF